MSGPGKQYDVAPAVSCRSLSAGFAAQRLAQAACAKEARRSLPPCHAGRRQHEHQIAASRMQVETLPPVERPEECHFTTDSADARTEAQIAAAILTASCGAKRVRALRAAAPATARPFQPLAMAADHQARHATPRAKRPTCPDRGRMPPLTQRPPCLCACIRRIRDEPPPPEPTPSPRNRRRSCPTGAMDFLPVDKEAFVPAWLQPTIAGRAYGRFITSRPRQHQPMRPRSSTTKSGNTPQARR
jgi:hypothetical protein